MCSWLSSPAAILYPVDEVPSRNLFLRFFDIHPVMNEPMSKSARVFSCNYDEVNLSSRRFSLMQLGNQRGPACGMLVELDCL